MSLYSINFHPSLCIPRQPLQWWYVVHQFCHALVMMEIDFTGFAITVLGYDDDTQAIGVCYEGGLDECGRPADTRTLFQKHSLHVLVLLLLKDYPGSRLCGHRDLSPDLNHNGEIEPEEWVKQCPCFDAATILTEPPPPNPACL